MASASASASASGSTTATSSGSKSLLGLEPPGHELVGETVSIRWYLNGSIFSALVIGYRKERTGRKRHKVWYPEDATVEDMDLQKRDWFRDNPNVYGWHAGGLAGKRIVVKRDVKYYEAFVIEYLRLYSYHYKVLCTADDEITIRDMNEGKDEWDLLEKGKYEFNGKKVVTWSTLPKIE